MDGQLKGLPGVAGRMQEAEMERAGLRWLHMTFVIFGKGLDAQGLVQMMPRFGGRRCLESSEESREPPWRGGQEHSTL